MWALGYRHCTYFGYAGTLTSFFETRGDVSQWLLDQQAGDTKLHKFSGRFVPEDEGGGYYEDQRASASREYIVPTKK